MTKCGFCSGSVHNHDIDCPQEQFYTSAPVVMKYKVIPNHYLGPAVISDSGWLVDYGPLEPIERICAALNAAETEDMNWAVPAFSNLQGIENERVLRALSKRIRQLTREQ